MERSGAVTPIYTSSQIFGLGLFQVKNLPQFFVENSGAGVLYKKYKIRNLQDSLTLPFPREVTMQISATHHIDQNNHTERSQDQTPDNEDSREL
jgi:hypothetical protein